MLYFLCFVACLIGFNGVKWKIPAIGMGITKDQGYVGIHADSLGIYFVRLFQGLGQTGVLTYSLGATGFCFQLWLVYVLAHLCKTYLPTSLPVVLHCWYAGGTVLLAEVADDILLFLERHSPYAHTLRLWSIHLRGGGREGGGTKPWVKFVTNLQKPYNIVASCCHGNFKDNLKGEAEKKNQKKNLCW